MSLKKNLILVLGLLLFWILAVTVFQDNLGSPVRFVSDYHDRQDYLKDARWFPEGKVPYRDTRSEYPQVATYFFTLPYLAARLAGVTFLKLKTYAAIFSLLMLALLVGAVNLLHFMLPVCKNRAFLLLLPAALYFTFNRFDILPAFLVLLALFLLQRESSLLAGVVLGIAALTKWYPALLLPAFLVYVFHTRRRADWKLLLAFILTCLLILAPTYFLGGFKAVLEPYLIHSKRGFEFVSIPALLQRAFPQAFKDHAFFISIKYLFLALTLLPAPLTLLGKLDSFEKLVRWCCLVVAAFILFSQIWSPQWILWVLPLFILASDRAADGFWIAAYGLINYAAFPLVFDALGPATPALILAGAAGFIVLLRYVVLALRRTDWIWQ